MEQRAGKPRLERALETWLERNHGRGYPPKGRGDRHGRWWPEDSERQERCEGMITLARLFPGEVPRHQLYRHCLSVTHVARSWSVDERELLRAIREYRDKEQ
ncbi:MAG TPA: hypothetical protein VFA95_13355 [Gammaproteobacteria bacterium]|nr:hypothetical protein [Gammaproteobacteria bacterium]